MPLACSSLACVLEFNSDSALSYCKEQQYVFLYAYYRLLLERGTNWVWDIIEDISTSCLSILSQSMAVLGNVVGLYTCSSSVIRERGEKKISERSLVWVMWPCASSSSSSSSRETTVDEPRDLGSIVAERRTSVLEWREVLQSRK